MLLRDAEYRDGAIIASHPATASGRSHGRLPKGGAGTELASALADRPVANLATAGLQQCRNDATSDVPACAASLTDNS